MATETSKEKQDPGLQLDGLIWQQRNNFTTLTRHYNSLKKRLDDESLNSKMLQNRLQIASQVWQLCIVTQTQICNFKFANEENEYFVKEEFEAAEEMFLEINDVVMTKLQILEEENRPRRASEFSQGNIGNFVGTLQQKMTSLPKITLPKFSGKPTDWATFRDYFISLIIKNSALDNLQRLHFLKSSVDGEALSLVKNIPLTENNFESAWDQLERRYENPRALINAELKSLFSIPAMKSDSVSALKAMRNHVIEKVAALENLGRIKSQTAVPPEDAESDGVSDILVFHFSQKLDNKTRLAWELQLGNTTEYPHFSKFLTFLDTRIRALEAIQKEDEIKSKSDTVRSHVVSNKTSCPLCTAAHKLFSCPEFKKKSVKERFQFVKSKKLCLNCFTAGHCVADCKSSYSCVQCQMRHHTLLHFKQNEIEKKEAYASSLNSLNVNTPTSSNSETPVVQSHHAASNPIKSTKVLLATAKIVVSSSSGRSVPVRAFLDQGSTWSFVTKELVNALQIRPRRLDEIELLGLGNASTGKTRLMAPIKIRSRSGQGPLFSTNALILDNLTNYVPAVNNDVLAKAHLQNLDLADDDITGSQPIHVIIGADLYGSVLLEGLRKGRFDEPVAQNTAFGWILSGKNYSFRPDLPSFESRSALVHHCVSSSDLDCSLERFWNLEEVPSVSRLTKSEEECELHFKLTHTRTVEGQYVVRYPFKSGPPINIGSSRKIAEKALLSLLKRFNDSPELFSQYKMFMDEYESLSHMSRISSRSRELDPTQVVYLTHHPVIRESSSTTAVRSVFNASRLTSNFTSLNDHMHVGPKLQTNLSEVLLQWRTYQFVYAADIAKMYRQILINEMDRDYQRILWIPTLNSEPTEFRLNTVTYGTAAAPFLALRVLRQLVLDEGLLHPKGSIVITHQTYIDDCLFGADSKAAIIEIREDVKKLLQKGHFKLRKWASNSPSLLADIDPLEHGLAVEKPLDENDSLKVLGIVWHPILDVYRFKIQLPEVSQLTKRSVLSLIARLFDPFGWVSPVIILAKIFMQKLWIKSISWDDILPEDLSKFWNEYRENLIQLKKISIPRWTGQGSEVIDNTLHGFSDASNVAYAAVVYLRLTFKSGKTRVVLLSSRTRVAPIKSQTQTVPRLELCGALLLAKLISAIKNTSQFSELKSICWTDSTNVLAWINKYPSDLKMFVANRVAAIQAVAPSSMWKHVPTKDNPADLASRGIFASKLAENHLWWHGPTWLSQTEEFWPSMGNIRNFETDLDLRVQTHHAYEQPKFCLENLSTRISSWLKLVRILAYVLKFLAIKTGFSPVKMKIGNDVSNVKYFGESEIVWLKNIQSQLFFNEISILDRKIELDRNSPLLSLNPFLDENRILRVGGRLANASMEFNRKFPIIIKAHPLVTLLIQHFHGKCLHGGTQLTLSLLRQNFWLIRGRQTVKSIIYKCIPCVRIRADISNQLMGALPKSRITRPARPFTHVGIDYAGPVQVTIHRGRGYKSHSAFIAVFVCFAIRAIHLELVSDYTTEAFLAALKRFVSRRGIPHTIHSDRGTNFQGASRELDETFQRVTQTPEVRAYLLNDKIRWEFIPPAAPHFGGIWESGVRSVKHHLRRVLVAQTPTFEELTTLLCQIEACLNSRPLCPLSDDPDDLKVLTPGHFLIGGELMAVPEISLENVKSNRLSRWQLWQQILETFWKTWSQDYILSLQQRNKWQLRKKNICIGQIVLVKNDNLPPTKWPLGRIVDVKRSIDNLVREVTVRTASGTYVRPITKLALLPIETDTPFNET